MERWYCDPEWSPPIFSASSLKGINAMWAPPPVGDLTAAVMTMHWLKETLSARCTSVHAAALVVELVWQELI